MEKRAEKRRMRTSTTGICPRGFTLLELIVVIFIISLALSVSFPSFTFRQEGKLKSEASRIASLLWYLNDRAVFSNAIYALNIILKDRVIPYHGPDGEKAEQT